MALNFIFFLLLIFIVCKISSRAKYFIKLLILYFGSQICAYLFLPLMILRGRDHRNAIWPSILYEQVGRILGVKFELRGLDNLTKEGAVVIMNHQNVLDLLVCAVLWPKLGRATTVVRRVIIFYFPLCWFWNTIFIDRNNAKQSKHSLDQAVHLIKNECAKLIVCPEGTRNEENNFKPFKKGAFHVAMDAECAIVPVVVSKYFYFSAKKHKFDEGRSIIQILPEIPTKGLQKSDLDMLIEKVQYQMQLEFEKLNREILGM